MATGRLSGWRSSLRFKVNAAIAGVFLAVVAALAVYAYVEERDRNLALAVAQLQGMNAFYFDSLNTLMLADAMEEREELRTKMLELPGITEVRVSRGAAVTRKFGPGLPSQQSIDALDRRALAGESVIEVAQRDGHRVVTVIEPYRLTENTRGTDCLECHRRVESGTVAGAIRTSYSLEQVDAMVLSSLWKRFGLLARLFLLGLLALSAVMQRLVRVPVAQALEFANAVAGGDLDNRIEPRSDDEMGRLIGALRTMQGNLRTSIDNDRRAAAENLRIRLALDSSATATTVSDADNRLVYLNDRARELFTSMAPQWRRHRPRFVVDELIGQRLSDLLPDGELSDTYRRQLDSPTRLDGRIAGRNMRLFTAPVHDTEGRYQGRVTQWEDLTEEIARADQEKQRLAEERRIAAANRRIRDALDQVSANVMLVDNDRCIVYANRSAQAMLRDIERDLRSELPGFDAAGVIGTRFDALLGAADGMLDERLPATLTQPHATEFVIGGRTLRLVAGPVADEDGGRLGTTLEWTDRTREVAVEREIDDLVEAASHGDLDTRIDTVGKTGFHRRLGHGFNRLLDELGSVFDDIARVMGHMAEGDLRHPIEQAHEGRFGQVKEDINRTLANFVRTVTRLNEVAAQVRSAADEISTGNANLSARTEQQAGHIEETVSSLQQLTSTVRNNADNAQQANLASGNARLAAARGSEVVNRAVEAMDQISAASARISEIIAVIDDIAFQTNLLALNASVEAARAGEQGRGFAVVATEVRNLASRSASSAREIKALIRDSGDKVGNGARLVRETGGALEEILGNVQKAGDLVSEIAAASVEQSDGIEQVNQAVTQIDRTTQQNAALAEQTSAASSAMRSNAGDLADAIAFFRTLAGASRD